MNNLSLYCLQDGKTTICSMFLTAVSDEIAIKTYVDFIDKSYKSIKKNDEKIKFLNAVHNSKVVRLADLDITKPDVVKNLAFIADLNDLVVDEVK